MAGRSFLLILVVALFLAPVAFPQALSAYLPAKSVGKAAKLLTSIDSHSAVVDSRRNAARVAQLKAEADAVEAYALISASRSGSAAWASPDGSAKAADAGTAFAAARSKAKAAAQALASPEAASGDAAAREGAAREAASDALSASILASGIGEKAATGLEKLLAGKTADLTRLLPEARELVALLLKAGAAGAREAAAALAHRGAENIARSLVASKARLLALSPASSAALSRLEAAAEAYGSWLAAFPAAAYPGDLGSASPEERAAFSSGVAALSRLGPLRAASLLDAMSLGDGRDRAAAEAARRLAQLWARSPAARRRDLASLCGLGESAMAVFAAAGIPGSGAPPAPPAVEAEPFAAVAALNGLEIAIADEETSGDAGRAPEPALLLLERPDLAALARREPRYDALCVETSRRLDGLLAQAADGALARLESSSAVVRSASAALGSTPTDMSVRAVDLGPGHGKTGRRIAFFATAADAAGLSVCFPLRADVSGPEYATSFARAARLAPSKTDPAVVLARYGQIVVSAYDQIGRAHV